MPHRREFTLPPIVTELVAARNKLREHYKTAGLKFTLDGNLIGDIGEATRAAMTPMRDTSSKRSGMITPNGLRS